MNLRYPHAHFYRSAEEADAAARRVLDEHRDGTLLRGPVIRGEGYLMSNGNLPCSLIPITAPDGIRDPQKEQRMNLTLSELAPLMGRAVNVYPRESRTANGHSRGPIAHGTIDRLTVSATSHSIDVGGNAYDLGRFDLAFPPFDNVVPDPIEPFEGVLSAGKSDAELRLEAVHAAVSCFGFQSLEDMSATQMSEQERAILDRAAVFYTFATNGTVPDESGAAETAAELERRLRFGIPIEILDAFDAITKELENAREKGYDLEHDRAHGSMHIVEEIMRRLMHIAPGLDWPDYRQRLAVIAGLAVSGMRLARHYELERAETTATPQRLTADPSRPGYNNEGKRMIRDEPQA